VKITHVIPEDLEVVKTSSLQPTDHSRGFFERIRKSRM
jgi:hypothetical protein